MARLLVELTEEMDAEDLAFVIHEARFLGKFSLEATLTAMKRANGRRHIKVLQDALPLHASGKRRVAEQAREAIPAVGGRRRPAAPRSNV